MSITTRSYAITIGTAKTLEIAQGEDRRFTFTFREPGSSSAKNMSGLQAAVLTVRSPSTGIELLARTYTSTASTPASGIISFDLAQADTASASAQVYDADVTWTDAGGYREQILVKSRFLLLVGVGQTGDAVTSPPAIPVVYGLNWRDTFSSPSGGYLVNDAVQAYDGSLGGTGISTLRSIASGVTFYPLNQSLLTPATGWAYVAQHGGALSTVVRSVTLPSPSLYSHQFGYVDDLNKLYFSTGTGWRQITLI